MPTPMSCALTDSDRWRRVLAAGLLGTGVAAWSVSAGAADWRGYLRLDGLTGVSQEERYPGWLPVSRIREGITNGASLSVGSVGLARVTLDPLQVTRVPDPLTPELFLAAANGRVFDKGDLELVKVLGGQAVFAKFGFVNLRLSGMTSGGTSDGGLSEVLTLSFTQITVGTVKISVSRAVPQGGGGAGAGRTTASTAAGDVAAAALAGNAGSLVDLAAGLNRNLLLNPGAEAGDESIGWSAFGAFGVSGWADPSALNDGADHGQRFFSAGAGTTDAAGSQVVDVSAAALAIDGGELQAVLAGWLGGGSGEADAARLVALFRDATGQALGSLRLGSAAAEAGQSKLARLEQAGVVPAGTRAIEVKVEFHRESSSEAPPVADDLSLVLEAQAAGAGDLPVEIELLRASGTVDRARVQLSWVPRAGGVVLESATRLEGPWRAESASTRLADGREQFTVPTDGATAAKFWRVRPAATLR